MRYTINKFRGIDTRSGRDRRPEGAFDDITNLVLNSKFMKGGLRSGYSADLTAAPTDVSGQTALASFRYPRGVHPATEDPTAQNIVVIAGTDGSSAKHYFQRPFWKKNNATLDSTNWMRYGEHFQTTMSAKSTNEFDLDSAPSGYGSFTDDLNGWVVYNITRSEQLFVSDSSTGHVVTLEDLPSDWANGDAIELYRSFHDNPTFGSTSLSPSWTDPVVLKVGNNIIASPGRGTLTTYKPIWSGLVKQTWFPDASRSPSYNQTYVSELELKNTGTWLDPQTAGTPAAETTNPLTVGKRYWIGFVWETFDGQRSLMYHPSTAYLDPSTNEKLSCALYVHFPAMDKRARYVHVFMAETDTSVAAATDVDWVNWFFVETHDMTDSASGFTYNNSTTVPAWYSKTIDLDLSDWNAVGADLTTFLGHTKPNRTTVAFSYGVVTAGRLFVAKYYDFYAGLNYNDSINFTVFAGNGVAQWSKLMDIDDATQTTVEAGDPSSIQALLADEARLIILKNAGSFYVNISADPALWILNDVSRKVGCDAPDSATVTPLGVIWASSGNGIYLWRAGDPIEISRNWRTSTVDFGGSALATGFRDLTTTYASQWMGWYDPFHRSYRIMYTSDGSNKKTVYEAFLDVEDDGLVWTKHSFAHNIGHVLVRSDNVIFFSDDSTKSYYFSGSASDDAGTSIKPSFDTGLISLGEQDLTLFTDFWMKFSPAVDSISGLDILIEVDGTQFTGFTSLLASATSKDRIASGFPIVGRLGTTFRFKFNSNATPVAIDNAFTILELGFNYEPVERGLAGNQSL